MNSFTFKIRVAIASNNYIISQHARLRMGQRHVNRDDILRTILHGAIIEQNLDAHPHPKCLFMYQVLFGEPLYVACGYNARNEQAIILTVHWFDPNKWIDWYTRRR